MRIACVGGGPAGLYFAALAKLGDPAHEVTVFERNPAGVTPGWGVVFWDDLVDGLYASDPVSARAIRRSALSWGDQEVRVGGRPVAHLGGYGFSIARGRLLGLLAERAAGLGVELRFGHEVGDPAEVADADLVVAADGAGSRLRRRDAAHFGPRVAAGRNLYIWLGTHQVFDAFTFAFERTRAGWIWLHAYRYDAGSSTCIVECPPETWRGLGLHRLAPDEALRTLERVFARHLGGHALLDRPPGLERARWLTFRRVSNATWHHGRVVLVGDAAHTTHFSIGSGTKLALEDAMALARHLRDHGDLPTALAAYEAERRAALRELEAEARRSARWFEDLGRHVELPPVQFAYALRSRRRGEDARWRYLLHLATQRPSIRRSRMALSRLRRARRAARREGQARAPASPADLRNPR